MKKLLLIGLEQGFAILVDFCTEPKSRQEMMDFMGLSNRDHFSKHYIKPLIIANRLAMADPNKPKSPNQKYVKV